MRRTAHLSDPRKQAFFVKHVFCMIVIAPDQCRELYCIHSPEPAEVAVQSCNAEEKNHGKQALTRFVEFGLSQRFGAYGERSPGRRLRPDKSGFERFRLGGNDRQQSDKSVGVSETGEVRSGSPTREPGLRPFTLYPRQPPRPSPRGRSSRVGARRPVKSPLVALGERVLFLPI